MIEKKYDRCEILMNVYGWKSILLFLFTTALFCGPNAAQAGPQGPTVGPQGNQGTYAVMTPRQMRPGAAFQCSLTLFSGSRPVTFKIRIQNVNSKVALVSGSDILTAASQPMTRTLNLQIPTYVPPGSYYVFVEGAGGQTFSENKSVTVVQKSLSIFIQTDKALYKPGQTVLFRCIAVYSNLLPYKNEINVTVYDQSDNKIKQSLNVKSSNGVIEQQLKLADQTPLGTWRIECTAGGNVENQKFTVAEYVLPKFEVSIMGPSFFLINRYQPSLQKDLDITVKALYTFGQPVKGVANITAEIQQYGYNDPSYSVKSFIVQLVNGTGQIRMSLNDLYGLRPGNNYPASDQWYLLDYRNIIIKASVLETATGVTQSGETTIPCTTNRYKLEFLQITPNTFRREMDFMAYLRLYQFDGTPALIEDFKDQRSGKYRSIAVKATMYACVYSPQYICSNFDMNVEVPLTPSGYQSFTMKFASNCTSVSLRADLFDAGINSTVWAYKGLSPFLTRDEKAGIKLKVDGTDGNVQPNTALTFTVRTTTATKTICYQVLGKGQIALSACIPSFTATTDHRFDISVTSSLAQAVAPSMTVVVWYMTGSQEMVADSIKLTVSGAFANKVSLTFDQEKAKPGDNVSLTVNACPGSFVGILAVDQSVILLQPGNRLTQDLVSSDLEEYSPYGGYDYGIGPGIAPPQPRAPAPSLPNPGPPSLGPPSIGSPGSIGAPGPSGPAGPSGGRQKRSSIGIYPWGWYNPGGSDSTQVLYNAGLMVFTNGYVYQYNYYYYYPGIPGMAGPAGMPGVAGMPGPQGAVGATGPQGNPPDDKAPSGQKTRSNFIETFLWSSMTAGPNNSVTIKAKVPDTITSWIASAFAVDDKCGLGVADTDAKLTVFETFFISVTSPYSVVRGEEFAYLVTVFNYLKQSLNVTVTLKKSSDFMVRTGRNGKEQSIDVTLTINVPSNDTVTVYYWIVPKSLGQIPILVQAQSSAAADAMQSMLLVKPEGVEQSYSTSVLIQLSTNGQTYNSTVSTTLPPNGVLVPGSQHITCTAIGDILGPSIQGLDKLIQLPTGCGEQNMVKLAPMVSVMKYLKATGQETKELMDKALSFMSTGYQRQLTYQHRVGSFSAFGESASGNSGSTWLTAFVLNVFCEARQYIPVEEDKMAKTMTWIISQQNSNGSFNEPGIVYNSNLPGGSAKGVAMTAYVLIGLCCNKNNSMIDRSKYETSVRLGTSFLLSQINTLNSDLYSLSIVFNALKTCGVNNGWESAFIALKNKAITQDGKTHWEQSTSDSVGTSGVAGLNGVRVNWTPSYIQSPSRNIELTSYVLLILASRKNVTECVPVCKWLVSQRNALGGYSNTQDTVMALKALSECALLLYGPSNEGPNLNVVCTAGTSSYPFQTITRTNALILQQIELPPSTPSVGIKASGKGTAIVQVNVKYHVYNVQNNNGIVLTVTTTSNGNLLSVTICSSWTGNAVSGMCLLEVNILTGYQVTNLDTLKNQSSGSVDRIENDKEKVVLYFNELSKTPICRTLTMRPEQMVNNVQRALIKLYRYYDKDSVSNKFYQPTTDPTPDHCKPCPQCCQMQVGKK